LDFNRFSLSTIGRQFLQQTKIAGHPTNGIHILFFVWTLIICTFLGLPSTAGAEERLDLQPYPYGMNPAPNIVGLLGKLYEYYNYPKFSGRYEEVVKGVQVDMDLDGKMELIVSLAASDACGIRSCSGYVLQGSNSAGWKVLTGVETMRDRIYVSKDTVNGYRVLNGPYETRIWNGVQFFAVCLNDECRRTFKQGTRY
jgi:hypothetical protein